MLSPDAGVGRERVTGNHHFGRRPACEFPVFAISYLSTIRALSEQHISNESLRGGSAIDGVWRYFPTGTLRCVQEIQQEENVF